MLNAFDMKIASFAVAGISCLTLLGACASIDDEPKAPVSGLAMQFDVETANSRAVASDETFETDGTAFKVWGSFGGGSGNAAPAIVFSGETVTRNSGKWTYSNTQYWLPGFEYDFNAIYPASAAGDATYDHDNNSITLTGLDSTKGIDLMAAYSNVDAATTATYQDPDVNPAPVDMRFSHLLSRITFRGYSDEKLLGTGRRIVVTKISIGGFSSNGDVKISKISDGVVTSDWTPATPTTGEIKSISGDTYLEYTGTDLFTGDNALLIIPQDIPDGAYLEVTYRYNMGADYEHTARANLKQGGITKWEAGKSYRYPFTFNEGIFFNLPTVDSWTDSPINGRPGFNVDIDNN